ncbi:hypothetical protein G3I01_11145 [Gramella sp. MT6]|uniref:PglD-related sugar-binding protein n=1 Tax=Gramella sp. MT6 TaxID=2705471 RepID=UPI001C5E33CA|nr:hypothetical protein [Gramella sp. MT6]QYA26048.1 hypothetical protein G3I01_11145 [Gramella sp. MT6]
MKNKKLIIYGIGSFAEYVQYLFDKDSQYEVVGFCVERTIFDQTSISLYNKPLIPFEDIMKVFPPESYYLFIAVGNNIIRKRIFNLAKELGYKLAKFISTKTICWEDLSYGENTFIDEGCKIHPYVEIGDNSIIMFSSIGHHTKIGSHNLISVSTLGGRVTVKNESFIGMNSVIKQNVTIASKNIIGMGCVIEGDTQENSVYSNKGTTKRNTTYDKVANRFLK